MENDYSDEFLKKAKPPFSKSKEEVWSDLESKITEDENQRDNSKSGKAISIFRTKKFMAAAAAITLLLSLSAFLKFYTQTFSAQRGEHITVELPDKSSVVLNAESEIKYAPYWWFISRELQFEGEAFFQVEKGSKFTVHSQNGSTRVLGTSFNINTRNAYQVFCKTGKVQVLDNAGSQAMISPNQAAKIINHGNIEISQIEKPELLIGWTEKKFIFDATPVNIVFDEIARQYNVDIEYNITHSNSLLFTGHFDKNENIKMTLEIVCENFGLKCKKASKSYYIITN